MTVRKGDKVGWSTGTTRGRVTGKVLATITSGSDASAASPKIKVQSSDGFTQIVSPGDVNKI